MGLSGSIVFAQLVLRSNFTRELTYAAADLDVFKKKLENFTDKAKQVGTVWTTRVSLPIIAGMGGVTKAAVDFESSFAGIKKTVQGMVDPAGNLTAAAVKLRGEIRGLAREIPISVHELAAIGETAGALGLPTDKIAAFTKEMAQLGATTDLTTQAATTGIAEIQNIYASAGVDTDRFASALVALGNEGASTEASILAMAGRIAGAGQVVGISQAEVLGLSSALTSVGIEAEMGGSAMSRVMVEIANAVASGGSKLEEFARISGETTAEFSQHFKTDAADAIGAFIGGLKRVKGEGENLFQTLETLNLDEIRTRDTLLRAMGASDMFAASLRLGTAAWKENTAAAREAQLRFTTVASLTTLLWNRLYDLAVTLGNTLLPAFRLFLNIIHALLVPLELLANAYAALPTFIHLIVGGTLLLIAALGPLAILLATVASSALALSGTYFILKSAFLILRGEVLQAPAALKALAYLLDNIASVTLKNGVVTMGFRNALDGAWDAVGRYTTRLLAANATAVDAMKSSAIGTTLTAQWNTAKVAVTAYATEAVAAGKAAAQWGSTKLSAVAASPYVQTPGTALYNGIAAAATAMKDKVGAATATMGRGWRATIDAMSNVMHGFTLDMSRNVTLFTRGLTKGTAQIGVWASTAVNAAGVAWKAIQPAPNAPVGFTNIFASIAAGAVLAFQTVIKWGKLALELLSSGTGAIGRLALQILSWFTWPVRIAIIIGSLLLMIPGMKGLIADIVAIMYEWGRIAGEWVVAKLTAFWEVLTGVVSAIKTFAADTIMAIPGMQTLAGWWNTLTGAVHEYRLELEASRTGQKTAAGALAAGYDRDPGVLRNKANDLGLEIGRLIESGSDRGGFGQARLHALVLELEQLKKQGAQIRPELQALIDKFRGFSGMQAPSLTPFLDQIKEADRRLKNLTTPQFNGAPGAVPFMQGGGLPSAQLFTPQFGSAQPFASAASLKDVKDAYLGGLFGDAIDARLKAFNLSELEIKKLTAGWDKEKAAIDAATQAADAQRKKIIELRETLNGLAAVKAGQDLALAMKGVDVAGMDPEQKASANATAKAAMKGITQQGDVAKQSQAMQDLYVQMQILDNKTRDLKTGFHHVWSVGADGLMHLNFVGKDADDMMKGLTESNHQFAQDLINARGAKVWAVFEENSKAAHDNREAVVALRIETAEMWAAANDTGPDTLQKKLAAISYQYQKQIKAVDTLHLTAEGGTERIIELTEQERAARALATAEYVKTLPMTRQMISTQREQAMAAIRDQIANAKALGLTTEAVERLKLKLKELKLEGRQALGAEIMKWADGFSQVGSAFSDFATYFDGKMGKLLAKAGEFAQEIGQIGKGIAQLASGDYIGGAINVIKGALDLFDVGETEYEKQAKAAGASFKDLRGELIDTYGSYDRLRQIAARTNTEIDLDFDPNGDAFQQLDQLEKQAKALEAAIAKVKAGLEKFASGAATRIDAFAKAFKVIGADGKATDQNSLAAGLAKLGGTRTQVEAEYQRLGTYAGATFLQTLREEGMAKAMDVAGPLFETITTLGDEVGLGLHGAAKAMADFFKVAKDNADVVQALDGIQQMVQGASDAAFLNAEMFTAFGEDVSLQFQRLQERGVDAGTAMALMQPTLQALWEAQKKYGFATDETTQKLIDEAVAAGIVGESQRDVNQQILDVLKAIAAVMGAEIPNAMGEMASAAEREAARMKTALDDATRDRDVHVNVNYDDPGYTAPGSGDPGGDGADPNMQAMGGFARMNYCATGGFIRPLLRSGGGGIDWTPRGTDTVPTLLTPGELVLNVAQQRNVGAALSNDPKALASAIASALKEGGIGGGEAGVVVLHSNGKPGDQFNAVLDSLPRALRQNKNGLRTALREALGIDA